MTAKKPERDEQKKCCAYYTQPIIVHHIVNVFSGYISFAIYQSSISTLLQYYMLYLAPNQRKKILAHYPVWSAREHANAYQHTTIAIPNGLFIIRDHKPNEELPGLNR